MMNFSKIFFSSFVFAATFGMGAEVSWADDGLGHDHGSAEAGQLDQSQPAPTGTPTQAPAHGTGHEAAADSHAATKGEGDHAGGHHVPEIPGETKYQVINILMFLGLLVYFTRAKVKAFFAGRYEEFNRLALETEKARKTLEGQKADLVQRTQKLKATSQQSIKDAEAQAEKAYATQIATAKETAAKMGTDVSQQIKDTEKKFIEQLRTEALELAMADAEKQLSAIDTNERMKITKSFPQRVEGATL